MFGKLRGKKTYVVAVVALIGTASAYLTGDITGAAAVQQAFAAVFALTLRAGMENAKAPGA